MAYERELEVALEAAQQGTAVVLEHYARFDVIPDARADITTAADYEAQEAVLQHLHRCFPADALRAEEKTATLADAPDTGKRMWIVDPIDGTRGFARKNGEFSVMVALVVEGVAVVGVVQEPARGQRTYAALGSGCWRQDDDTAPARCRVTTTRTLAAATLIQSHSREPSLPVQRLRPGRVVECYSAGVKMARVARGEADLYVNTYPSFGDWDICAGHILVTEAGGRATGLKGEELVYGRPGAKQDHGLLADNGVLHELVLAGMRG